MKCTLICDNSLSLQRWEGQNLDEEHTHSSLNGLRMSPCLCTSLRMCMGQVIFLFMDHIGRRVVTLEEWPRLTKSILWLNHPNIASQRIGTPNKYKTINMAQTNTFAFIRCLSRPLRMGFKNYLLEQQSVVNSQRMWGFNMYTTTYIIYMGFTKFKKSCFTCSCVWKPCYIHCLMSRRK
jgi:hypothetical protein